MIRTTIGVARLYLPATGSIRTVRTGMTVVQTNQGRRRASDIPQCFTSGAVAQPPAGYRDGHALRRAW